MSTNFKFAAYPSAKIFDVQGKQIQHLLWGDWVRIDGPINDGLIPVHSRGVDGFMRPEDLQEDQLLEIVFVDVGQGDGCLLVTPKDEKIIIDAGISDNMFRYLRWRFNFLGGPRKFDAAIITHPDQDHYLGFNKLFEHPDVKFEKIYHNGIMEFNSDSKPFGKEKKINGIKYITDLMLQQKDLEQHLSDQNNVGRKKYPNLLIDALQSLSGVGDRIQMLRANPDPTKRNYLPGFDDQQELSIEILNPVPELDSQGNEVLRWFKQKPNKGSWNKGKTKNGHSVVLKLKYKELSIMLGGDLNSSSEAFLLSHYTGLPWPPIDSNHEHIMIEAARNIFQSDISKSCHHGSADFTDTFMKSLNSSATVISSGDEESHAHPRSDTLGAIGRHGRGWRPLIFSTELARSTREDEGNMKVEIGKILEKLDNTTDEVEKRKLREQRDEILEEILKRNVTVYGAITLKTDGEKAILAYKLEKPRRGNNTIGKWDIYSLEKAGNGPLVYVDK